MMTEATAIHDSKTCDCEMCTWVNASEHERALFLSSDAAEQCGNKPPTEHTCGKVVTAASTPENVPSGHSSAVATAWPEGVSVELTGLRSLAEIQAEWMALYDEIRSFGDNLKPSQQAIAELFLLGNRLLLEASLSGMREGARHG